MSVLAVGRGSADSYVAKYRPDIDGLRCIAVLSVVLFHLSRQALPGGFLGVDVFFVISGYLITDIILREAGAGKFTIRRFYERRVRRIAPALLTVLTVTTVASFAILLPVDLIGYAKSVLATLGFVSNVYFWRDTDYFSRAAEMKPLLHTWTLGVEEQFYILFPLLLAVLVRFLPRSVVPAIAALTILSLIGNILASVYGGDTPAFYLLPTRAWELGAGAVLAAWRIRSARPALNSVLSLLGAILVVTGLAGLALPAPFPAALPVVIGAVLVIWSGNTRTPVSALLSTRIAVGIGLISYSLYLWHWPIIALGGYYLVAPLGWTGTPLAVIAMFALAYLSWRYIERPFREKTMPARTVWISAAIGAAAVAGAAFILIAAQGFPSRLNARASRINAAVGTHYRCAVTDYLVFGAGRACVLNLPSRKPTDAEVVLLGNSHAQQYGPLVKDILEREDKNGLLVPANGCLPTLGVNIDAACLTTARNNIEAVAALPGAKLVVIATTWVKSQPMIDAAGKPIDNHDLKATLAGLDATIVRLQSAGKKVVLVGPIAIPGYDIASDVSRRLAFGRPIEQPTAVSRSDFDRDYAGVIAHFQNRKDVRFIRPDLAQCDAERCYFIKDSHSLFSDSSHLARAALPMFRQQFEQSLHAPD